MITLGKRGLSCRICRDDQEPQHAPGPRTSPITQTVTAPMPSLRFESVLKLNHTSMDPEKRPPRFQGGSQPHRSLYAAHTRKTSENPASRHCESTRGANTRDARRPLTAYAKRKALSRGLFSIAGNAALCRYGATGGLRLDADHLIVHDLVGVARDHVLLVGRDDDDLHR